MSPRMTWPGSSRVSFPRVSGDEPARVTALNDGGEFSPRERG